MKNILMILFVTANTILSQLILKKGVLNLQKVGVVEKKLLFLLNAVQSPYIVCAVLMQGVGYVVWMFVISRVKLGAAFAISGSFFYILMALAGWVFYNESLNGVQWGGLLLITIGVLCMAWNLN